MRHPKALGSAWSTVLCCKISFKVSYEVLTATNGTKLESIDCYMNKAVCQCAGNNCTRPFCTQQYFSPQH